MSPQSLQRKVGTVNFLSSFQRLTKFFNCHNRKSPDMHWIWGRGYPCIQAGRQQLLVEDTLGLAHGSLFAQVYGNVGQNQPTGNCYVPWLELARAFPQLSSTALGSLTVSVTPVFPFFIFSSLVRVQGLPNTYMATVYYFGCGSYFPICLNFASTHCLLRSWFSSSPKAQLLCDLLSWTLWTASFQLVSPSAVCAPLLTCLSSGCQSTRPGLSVFCQLTATTQRIASSCHTMNASRPSGSCTALPCILSATEPCLFSFPVCLVYREMIPVLVHGS